MAHKKNTEVSRVGRGPGMREESVTNKIVQREIRQNKLQHWKRTEGAGKEREKNNLRG